MKQLELDFEGAIALARINPVQMEPLDLWDQVVPSLEGMSKEEKLRLAGICFLEIAEVFEQKAEAMFADWCDRHNDEGPIPDDDFLAGLIQETMFLDVSDVVRSPKGRRKVEPDELEIDSSVEEMDKEELLLLLEAAEVEVDPAPPMSIEQLECDESVDDWIQLIQEFMAQCSDEILFSEIVEQHVLPRGKAWMAVTLGKFQLEQQGDFYTGDILVG